MVCVCGACVLKNRAVDEQLGATTPQPLTRGPDHPAPHQKVRLVQIFFMLFDAFLPMKR